MINMKKHLGSKREFTHWLTTLYLFYFINRLVDVEEGSGLLAGIHERSAMPNNSRDGEPWNRRQTHSSTARA